MGITQVDLLVIGDELESCLAAVSAAMTGARVVLVRLTDHPWLGGLSTRGGLAYMDITPETTGPLFQRFLDETNVRRVALQPQHANAVLREWFAQWGVQVITLPRPACWTEILHWDTNAKRWQLDSKEYTEPLTAKTLIDATPDAEVVVDLGADRISRLGGLCGERWPSLGVSPVFQTVGLSRAQLIDWEALLRNDPTLYAALPLALPHLSSAQHRELIERPIFSPEHSDYIDILNPIIGVAFHLWQGWAPETYPTAPVLVDGFNIARLEGDTLSWNGLVMRTHLDGTGLSEAELVDWSQGVRAWPDALTEALRAFERFLQVGFGTSVRVLWPEQLYVRQSRNVQCARMLTGLDLLAGGGIPAEDAIGSHSYWMDLRGVPLHQVFPSVSTENNQHWPKVTYNVGLQSCRPVLQDTALVGASEQLALVSRSAGFSPLAQGACRIVQHLCQQGEALGIAAGLAAQGGKQLWEISPADIRGVLAARRAQWQLSPWTLVAQKPALTARFAYHPLFLRDTAIVAEV